MRTLKRIYTETQLKTALQSLPMRSYRRQVEELESSRTKKKLRDKYKIGYPQAKRLAELGLSHEELERCKGNLSSASEIDAYLRERGVKSKPLREKLINVMTNGKGT